MGIGLQWQWDMTGNGFCFRNFGSFVKNWKIRTVQKKFVVVFREDDTNWPYLFGCYAAVFFQADSLNQHKPCSGRTGRFHLFIQDLTLADTQLSGTGHVRSTVVWSRKKWLIPPAGQNCQQNAHIEALLEYFKNDILVFSDTLMGNYITFSLCLPLGTDKQSNGIKHNKKLVSLANSLVGTSWEHCSVAPFSW